MISIRKPISPTFCPTLRTIPSIASKSSSPGTLPFAKSIEPRNPTNTTPIVSTMPPSWTRLTRLCQYGLAWTLTPFTRLDQLLCRRNGRRIDRNHLNARAGEQLAPVVGALQRPLILRLIIFEDHALPIRSHFEVVAIGPTPLGFKRVDAVIVAVQFKTRWPFVQFVAGIFIDVDWEGHCLQCGIDSRNKHISGLATTCQLNHQMRKQYGVYRLAMVVFIIGGRISI